MANFIKYLERLVTEVKKAETFFERFEDTTLNEGNLTELPPCKSWNLGWKAKERLLQKMLMHLKVIWLMQIYTA